MVCALAREEDLEGRLGPPEQRLSERHRRHARCGRRARDCCSGSTMRRRSRAPRCSPRARCRTTGRSRRSTADKPGSPLAGMPFELPVPETILVRRSTRAFSGDALTKQAARHDPRRTPTRSRFREGSAARGAAARLRSLADRDLRHRAGRRGHRSGHLLLRARARDAAVRAQGAVPRPVASPLPRPGARALGGRRRRPRARTSPARSRSTASAPTATCTSTRATSASG